MCDYSLESVASRPAKVGDKLIVHNFGTGCGFADVSCPNEGAVCVKPGTELVFDKKILVYGSPPKSPHNTAIFRQFNKDQPYMHHDALEFPDGNNSLLAFLCEGQIATVLQLPAEPKTEQEAKNQERVAILA